MSKNRSADWEKIRNEYVAGEMSLTEISDKYNLSISTLRKHCAAEKWNEKRAAARERQADLVQEKLCEKKARQTVSDIEKVVKVANKLLQKISKAANELDKMLIVKTKEQHIESNVKEDDEGKQTTDILTETHYKYERYKCLTDTKKLSNLTKSLVDVKDILTSLQGEGEAEESGVLIIPAMPLPLEPPIDNEVDYDG